MKYPISFLILFLVACINTKNKRKEESLYHFDTSFSMDKSDPHYTVHKRDSNNKTTAYYQYNGQNKLIKINENFNWGWFDIEFNENYKTVYEFLNADTSSDRNDVVLNNKYSVSNYGDTLCEQSCYYFIDLPKYWDSGVSVKFNIFIPCSGFSKDSELSYSGRITITNDKDVFKLHDFDSDSKSIKVEVGNLKSGNYRVFGEIYIYNIIKGTNSTTSYRTLYLDKSLLVR